MKYINLFENFTDYEKYLNKFFILLNMHQIEPDDNLSMCKMLKIEDNFINWEEYDYDDFEEAYQVISRGMHIRDFEKYHKILNTFDTFKKMKKEFNLIKNTNKYGL